MGSNEGVKVGLMGMGVVGGGVARIMAEKKDAIACQAGFPIEIKRILVRNPGKRRGVTVPPSLLTTCPEDILNDPEVSIVVEVIGGETPALDLMKEAIRQGKHVVTANKEVMAKYGPGLLVLAHERGVEVYYEASVGGGIPLIGPFRQGLLANDISAIYAIINGTTNYILTRMAQEGLDLPQALKEAQALGYAEPDPSYDVEGIDPAYKLAILSTLAFRTHVRPEDVYREGILRLNQRDFRYAKELGYAIKLLAIAKSEDGSIQVRVHPTFLPQDSILAKVDGVFNAVQVEGDLVGKVLFYGMGAGSLPTASAVVADIIDLAQRVHSKDSRPSALPFGHPRAINPVSQLQTRYYVRMNVADRPGVLALISRVLGDREISIASVIQKETDETAQTAEIVIMTHRASEASLQKALGEMAALSVVSEIGNCIRVED